MADPDTGFARPVELDVDRDGQIYVLDAQDLRIRVYSPAGRLLRLIGRRGQGPGEFEDAPRFGIVGDTIWAIDGFRSVRFTLFDRMGTVLSTARADAVLIPLQPPTTMWGVIAPRRMRPDGLFLAELSGTAGGRNVGTPPAIHAPDDTIAVPRLLYDATGAIVDTAGWMYDTPAPPLPQRDEVTIGSTRYRLPRAPTDEPLIITALDGLFTIDRSRASSAAGATFRVTRHALSGDTVYTKVFHYQPKPYDDAYRDRAAWRTVQLPSGGIRIVNGMPEIPPMPADSMAIFHAIRPKLRFPEFQTPIRNALLAADDRLWLEREEDESAHARWLILEPDASPYGILELPRSHELLWSKGDVFWMVEEDELGVPWVVRYQIVEQTRR